MSRNDRDQLKWVHCNRSRPSRVVPAGREIERLAAEVQRKDVEPALAAADALALVVDDEFRRHCRLAGAANGVLTIHVDAEPMVSVMRMKWHSVVQDRLSAIDGRWGGGRVRFASGRSGVTVPQA